MTRTRSLATTLVTSVILTAIALVSLRLPVQAQTTAAAAPGDTELLRSAPFDRLTLMDGTVLIIDPISPRPLPPYDPTKQKERRRDREEISEEGNIIVGVPTRIEAPKIGRDANANAIAEDEVKLHLLQGTVKEIADFKTKRTSIKKIEYFEDMLLEESDRLAAAHDYARAFECCLRVQMRNPGWKGLDDRVNNVLFAEGRKALQVGDGEKGLRLMRELLGRRRDYPGLLDQVADAYSKRIERALKIGLYARGRQILQELKELAPEHAQVKEMRDRFVEKATRRVKDSQSAPGPERLDALVEALRIWPELEAAPVLYEKAFAADPTLEVAVNDVASPLGPWVRSPADARVSRMLYFPVLARDDDDARKGKRPDQLADVVESSDLGRRLVIKIRPGFLWSDGSRPVSAIDVARDLIDRTDPHSIRYDARWAEQLDRVDVADETRLEIRLNHAPLKTGAWLLGPVGPAHAGVDGRVATSSQERPLVTDGRFRCVAALANLVELRLREDVDTPASLVPGADAAEKAANEKPAQTAAPSNAAEKPAGDKTAGKAADSEPADEPVDEPAAKPAASKAARKPAGDKTAGKAADSEPADEPVDEPAASKAARKPAGDKTAGKAADSEPADEPVGDEPAASKAAGDKAAGTAADPVRPANSTKIKRIREIHLKQGESAVAALLRGEVTLIEHVPPDQAASLATEPGIKVGRYNKPVVHVIALDGRNPALRSRSLRRGLSYALDRKSLLEDYMLKRPPLEQDAVADGPFPKGSYADAPGVKPMESQPWLAKMLVAAARKELNNSPIKLLFEYPGIPEVRAIVPRIADAFRVAGVQIDLAEVNPSRFEIELRGGRPFTLAYRVLNIEDPVLDAGVLLCPGYDAPAESDALASSCSPRILQLLLQLERASDYATVRDLVIQVDRETRDELPVIPLWQVTDHYAWRDRLTGPGETADRLYQGIETWEIAPWFAKDAKENE